MCLRKSLREKENRLMEVKETGGKISKSVVQSGGGNNEASIRTKTVVKNEV